ncbi:MAG: RHS repeat protein [Acidobacteria bacterium]|nr:RHS repeat protein [Acidobacteriota bacterium]
MPDATGQLPASQRFVKVRSQIDATNWKEAYTWADGLGRAIKTQSVDSAGDVFVETQFDSYGRPWKTSNPYRTGETVYWTENFYDTAGRVFKVKSPDNAEVETFYGLATTGSQIGIVVTVEDQADKQRRSITNALGQLIRVDEPDNSSATGSLGSITSPNQPTLYTYDTLNNLATVLQEGNTTAECGGASTCTQTRTFTYDALSRLKSATNPESGLIQYGYDNNGNLTSKVDARSITTSYVYDALNRVTNRNYTNEPSGSETADVSYFYDNLPNAKGRLIKVTNGTGANSSTTEYTAFDILGRVTGHKQTTDGTAYTTGYVYNLSGALIEETYPSGRVVRNTLGADGDLMQVQSRKANDTFRNYANAFTYNAAGAVTGMRLGNGKWETTQFNSRLQPTQIGLGSSASSQNLLKLNYTYNTSGNADNNGNVLSQTITVPTVGANQGFTATQTYTYDSLNRLNDAKEMIGTTETWKQTFVYDRYGNRTFDTTLNRTTTIPTGCPTAVCNPSANVSDNKLKASDGYLFDNSGNTTTDAENRTFIYDAENKQVRVNNAQGLVGQYFYDGDGKRVKKIVPGTGEVTIFVYDAVGKLVAEYSTIVEPPASAKISYLTNDHLGSPRINTDATGTVTSRHDYHPFGEEIATSQRIPGLGYSDDAVRKQFTAYERDMENGLDFAGARYYGSYLGRFSSVDPVGQVSPINPQTLNKYVYAINSPYRFVDRNGKWPTEIHNLIFLLSLPGLSKQEMQRMQDGSYSVDMPTTVLGYYANQHGMCKPSQGPFECVIGVITAPMPDAIRIGEVSDSLSKHWYFGAFSHTGQDIGSPAHGFQVYDDKNFLACALSLGTNLVACAFFRKEVLDHSKQEEVITQTQLNQQIQFQRNAYEGIFGKDALKRGLGIFANARFEFSGPIDGLSLPTVVIDDLGVVTVYPDGREVYEGPLDKKKREKR